MLSAYGAQVIAFQDEGALLHPHCAAERYSSVTVEKAERGLTTGTALEPRIRYSLESDYDPEGVSCDHCGLWIVEPSWRPVPGDEVNVTHVCSEYDEVRDEYAKVLDTDGESETALIEYRATFRVPVDRLYVD